MSNLHTYVWENICKNSFRLVHKHCHRTKTRCTWNYWANCNREQMNRDRNRVPFPHSLGLRLSSPSYYGLLCNKLSFYPHRFIKSTRFSLARARVHLPSQSDVPRATAVWFRLVPFSRRIFQFLHSPSTRDVLHPSSASRRQENNFLPRSAQLHHVLLSHSFLRSE